MPPLKSRERGGIDQLPSGALRVRVYAGLDPISRRRHYLTEIVPADTPKAAAEARKVRTRLLNQVDERRHPRTKATVSQLVDRYLEQHTGARSTLRTYRGYVDKHVRPLLGELKVGSVDAETLDSFYNELRRCRDHCRGRRHIEHRVKGQHECDDRCHTRECRPLQPSGIRQIHFLLSGAFKRAVRWHWVSVNPLLTAEPPSATAPNPHPPSAEEAARIISTAFADADWGAFVWLTMTTGSRRGEMCALQWRHVDLDNGVLMLEKSIGQDGAEIFEKDTKTHQRRHLVLDAETVEILREHWQRCEDRAAALGQELDRGGFVFSADPDGSTAPKPSSITQRYGRLARRLGIETTLHALRHYSATELIAAGVDVRTVAGRLGHGGGGATTLRVYSAWIGEADQRAARNLGSRMPSRPKSVQDPVERAKTDPQFAYEVIAAEIRKQILDGRLPKGALAPTLKELAAKHAVAAGTAHRALSLLKTWGLVGAGSGRRAVIVRQAEIQETQPEPEQESGSEREQLDLEVIHLGARVRRLRAEADPNSTAELRGLLLDAVRRNGGSETQLGEYEMNVRYAGERVLITTFVASAKE